MLAEMARILRPGGRAVVVDLLRHDRDDFRREMGQLHLGFERRELEELLTAAGFARRALPAAAARAGGQGPGPADRSAARATGGADYDDTRKRRTKHDDDRSTPRPRRGRSSTRSADLSLAEWGRKEILLAEQEMPGLMAVRAGVRRPRSRCKGQRVTGSLHMTIQTAVLVETLKALGAEVRWARATSSRPRTTPRPRWRWAPRARRENPQGHPGLRLEGRDASRSTGT